MVHLFFFIPESFYLARNSPLSMTDAANHGRELQPWEVPMNLPRGHKHHMWLLQNAQKGLVEITLQDTAVSGQRPETPGFVRGLPSLRPAETPLYGILVGLAQESAYFDSPEELQLPNAQPKVFFVEYAAIHRLARIENPQEYFARQR